jgi:hypothetical protein
MTTKKDQKENTPKISFDEFCVKYLDRLYTPNIPFENQSTGYKQLRLMVQENVTPATKEETERWEKYPTVLELTQIPETKYMRSLHPLLRDYVRDNWEIIKKLEI